MISSPGAPIALGCALAVVLGGCGGSSGASSSSAAPAGASTGAPPAASPSPGAPSAAGAAPAAAQVTIASFSFMPAAVTVRAGGRVTWRNSDPAPHTATVQDASAGPTTFNTGTLAQHASKTVSFTKPGTYNYVCLFHAFMKATVVVR